AVRIRGAAAAGAVLAADRLVVGTLGVGRATRFLAILALDADDADAVVAARPLGGAVGVGGAFGIRAIAAGGRRIVAPASCEDEEEDDDAADRDPSHATPLGKEGGSIAGDRSRSQDAPPAQRSPPG